MSKAMLAFSWDKSQDSTDHISKHSLMVFPGVPKQPVPSSWPLVLATQVLYDDCDLNKEAGQTFFPTSM